MERLRPTPPRLERVPLRSHWLSLRNLPACKTGSTKQAVRERGGRLTPAAFFCVRSNICPSQSMHRNGSQLRRHRVGPCSCKHLDRISTRRYCVTRGVLVEQVALSGTFLDHSRTDNRRKL